MPKKALACFMSILLCTSMTSVSPFSSTQALADTIMEQAHGTSDNNEGATSDTSNDSGEQGNNSDAPTSDNADNDGTSADGSDQPTSDAADAQDQSSSDANQPDAQSLDDNPQADEPSAQSMDAQSDEGVPTAQSDELPFGQGEVYTPDGFDPTEIGSIFVAERIYWNDFGDLYFDETEIDPDMVEMYEPYSYKMVYQIIGDGEVCVGIKDSVGGLVNKGRSGDESAFGFTIEPSNDLYYDADIASNDIPETVVVPSQVVVDGITFNVTTVADNAFSSSNYWLYNIRLSEGITTIGTNNSSNTSSAGAFLNNSVLETISLPSTLETIYDAAFSGCSGLTEITIPASVKTIGTGDTLAQAVFHGCEGLQSVTFEGDEANPAQVENFGTDLFWGLDITEATLGYGMKTTGVRMFTQCTNLESVSLPETLETLNEGTFYGCSGLHSIVLPNSLKTIGKEAFRDCTWVQRVGNDTSATNLNLLIPASVEVIGEGAFKNCTSMTSFMIKDTFPTSITEIHNQAFLNTHINELTLPVTLKKLGTSTNEDYSATDSVVFSGGLFTALVLPESLEFIGAGAFRGNTNITSVWFKGDNSQLAEINSHTFEGCTGLATLTAGISNDPDKNGGKVFDSITTIHDYAFANTAIKKLVLHEGLTTLGTTGSEDGTGGSMVFANNNSLASIELPSTLENYGANVFYNTGVTEIKFNGTKSTGDYMFNGCRFLESVTLPASLGTEGGTIGKNMFNKCLYLSNVTFEDGYSVAGDYMFDGCTALRQVELPETLTDAGDHLFNDCTGLTEIVIPKSLEHGSYMFAGCRPQTITFEEGCTKISDYLFAGLTSMTSLELPDTLEELGAYAFKDCTGLNTITLPASLTTMGENVFDGCTNLENIIFGEGFKVIGAKMFANFTQMKSVTLPDTLEELGDYAFQNCTGLTSITLPASLIKMGENVFDGCTNLTDIKFGEGFKVIGAKMFANFTQMTSVTLPDTLEELGDYAFQNCTGLTTITLPASLKVMGVNVFDGCTNLTDIKFGEGFTVIGSQMFKDFVNLETIELPKTLIELGDYAFQGCTNLKSITLPASLTTVGEHVFDGCDSLATVNFDEGYTVVGDYMFTGLAGLQNITLPNTLTEIGAYAFQDCAFVENVDLSNVTKIGEGAFSGCTKITKVNLASVTEIGANAFAGSKITHLTMPTVPIEGATISSFADCANLVYVHMGGTVSVDDAMFEDCTNLTTVVMPNVTAIGNSVFKGCTNLESIDLGKVTTIGNSAFEGCSGLTSIDLTGVTSLGDSAFADCSSLATVNLAAIQTIGENTFKNCTVLTGVDFENIVSIGEGAFSGCVAIDSADLANVETLGNSAFEGAGLTEVSVGSNLQSVGNRVFASCPSLVTVNLPEGINITSTHMFASCANLTTVNFVAAESGINIIDALADFFTGASSGLATLGPNMFEGCAKLANIDFSKVDTVGVQAFKDCTGLVSPDLSKTLVFESLAFENCTGITEVDLSSATSVAADAFKGTGLTSIVFPSTDGALDLASFTEAATLTDIDMGGATAITAGLFTPCTGLVNLKIDNVREIPDLGFWGCSALKSISMKSAQSIGASAFFACTALESVEVEKLQTVNLYAFYGCTSLNSIDLSGVSMIGSSAFAQCAALTDVTLGDNVTVDAAAFSECTGITKLAIGDDASIESQAFDSCTSITEVVIGSGANIASKAFNGETLLQRVTIGDGSTIGQSAFGDDPADSTTAKHCPALATVNLGKDIVIGAYAFRNCSTLATINLEGVTSIGDQAFEGCTSITTADLTSATSVSNNAFKNAAITSLVMPKTPSVINFSAFDGRDKIVNVDMGGATEIGANQFVGCSNLETVTLHDVTVIGSSAFEGITTLKTIDLSGVRSIGDNAFARSGLTSITLPSTLGIEGGQVGIGLFEGCADLATVAGTDGATGITAITANMFKDCTALVTVDLSGIDSIGAHAFEGCTSLTDVTLDATQEIGMNAFTGCAALENIDLSKVNSIGDSAFSGCASIEEVNLDAATSIRENAFAGTSIVRLTLPAIEAVIDFSAFGNCTRLEYVDLGGATTVTEGMFTKCANLEEVKLNNVTSIAKSAFDGCAKLETVDLSKVTSIGELAFNGCSALSSIDLSGVASIGASAFFGCNSLGDIDLTGATTIGSNAFTNTAITSVVLGENLSNVGSSVFSGCTSLTDVTLPEGITQTGQNMFYGCTGLTSVYIPASLGLAGSVIGDGMFQGCVNLEDVQLGTDEAPLKIIGNHMFDGCDGLTTIDLSNVESIGDSAFARCLNLTELDLSQVGYVGNLAFDGANVKRLTLPADTTVIDFEAFAGCDRLEYVNLGGATSIRDDLFASCKGLKEVVLNNVTTIGARAFAGCDQLEDIDLTKITSIGDNAFDGCSALTTVCVPATVATIGDSVFANCTGITEAILGSEDAPLETVAPNMFNGCTSLVTADLENVITIGAGAFTNCDKLEVLNLTNATTIADGAFAGTKVKRLYLPLYLQTLATSAFEDCDNLVYVNLGGVKNIGDSAFVGCANLETVVFNYVETIGDSAFAGCETLKSVNCDNVSTIGSSAFENCTGIASVNLGGLTSIGEKAFAGCVSIDEISLPATLDTVADGAFMGCTALADVTMPAVATVGDNAFDGCRVLVSLDAPSMVNVGDSAFENCARLADVDYANIESIGASAFKGTAITTVDLKKVNSIGDAAFESTKLTVVIIESLPETIGDGVFRNCTSLDTARLKEGITVNSSEMFKGCTALKTVTFESSGEGEAALATLGADMFDGCANLSTIDLTKIKAMGDGAFNGCTSIKDADLSNLEELNPAAFTNTAINNLRLPSENLLSLEASHMANFGTVTVLDFGGVSSITPGALDALTGLKTATLNSIIAIDEGVFTGNTALETVNTGILANIGDRSFQNCMGLATIGLSEVTSIGVDAFAGCTALKNIDLSKTGTLGDRAFAASGVTSATITTSLQSAGASVFSNCADLATLNIESGAKVPGDNMFAGCSSLSEVNIGAGSTLSGNSLFENCTAIQTLNVPGNVTISGDTVFDGCASLASVTLDAGVSVSGADVFADCTAMTSLTLNDGVSLTGTGMFKGCTGLTAVTAPSSVTEITEGMFQDCTGLVDVNIPAVTKIGTDGFKDCSALVTVEVGPGFTEIGNGAFENCEILSTLDTSNVTVFGDSSLKNTKKLYVVDLTVARSIGTSAFEGAGLQNVKIGKDLTQSGNAIFSGCLNLVDLILDDGAHLESNETFKGCSNLGSVKFGAGVSIKGNEVFADCQSLRTVDIANQDVELIGDYVFSGCGNLVSADLPKTLLIGVGTFMDCVNLERVTVVPYDETTYTFADNMFQNCEKLRYIDLIRVTSIGESTFENCKMLESVTLTSAESIGNNAFAGCTALTAANLPKIVHLGDSVFSGSGIQSLTLSDAYKDLGPAVLEGCDSTLVTIDLKGVTNIQDETFRDFALLKTVTMDNAENVGANAFNGCVALEKANMSSVKTMGDGAFEGCLLIEDADLSSLTELNHAAFTNTSIKNLILPSEGIDVLDSSVLDVFKDIVTVDVGGVKRLDNSAFADCLDLVSVKLNSVDTIDNGVFNGCAKLTDIDFGNVVTIGSKAFEGCISLVNLVNLDGVETLGTDAFAKCSGIVDLELPASITEVGTAAFAGCTGLTNLTFQEGYSATGVSMFDGCTSLVSVQLPGSIENPAAYMFQNCSNLTDVVLGTEEAPLKTLSPYMFSRCTSLVNVDLSNVEKIEDYAFIGCTALLNADLSSATSMGRGIISGTSVINLKFSEDLKELPENTLEGCNTPQVIDFGGIETIRDGAFANYSRLREISIPAVGTIGYHAFLNCVELNNVTFKDGVDIGPAAFVSCRGISEIDLSNVGTIGANAFQECAAITEANIDGASSIGENAFQSCNKLATVSIASATEIGANAFNGCRALADVTIGSAESIGEAAFANIPITSITLPGTLGANDGVVGANIFSGCTSLATVTLEEGLTTIYEGMFADCENLTSINTGAIETVGDGAFKGAPLASEIDLSSATAIGQSAFEGTIISQAVMPNIQSVGADAFKDCASLTLADISNISEEGFVLKAGTFDGCSRLAKLVLPTSINEIGTDALNGTSALSTIELRGYAEAGTTAIPATGFADAGAINLKELVFYGPRLIPSDYDESVEGSGLFDKDSIKTYVTLYFYDSMENLATDEEAGTYETASGYICLPYDQKLSNVAYDRIAASDIYDSNNYFGSEGHNPDILNDDMDSVFISATGEPVSTQRQRSEDTLRCYFFNCDDLIPQIKLADGPYTYTGSAIEPLDEVTVGGHKLSSSQYRVTYENNVDAGEAKIVVSLLISGVAYGTVEETFTIDPADIADVSIEDIEDMSYISDPITPEPVVTFNEVTLEKDTDYTLEYEDNIDVGTAKITLTGTGNFQGTTTTTFEILQGIISQGSVAKPDDVVFKGSEHEPELVVTMFEGTTYEKTLVAGTDYTVEYSDNVDVGTATATIKGAGGYTGELSTTFNIVQKSIADVEISDLEEQVFTGEEIEPDFTLTDAEREVDLEKGVDYDVAFKNNVIVSANIGRNAPTITITGKGNYTGTVTVKFAIIERDINDATVTGIEDVTYNGTAFKPEPVVVMNEGEENETLLRKNNHYLVDYVDNTDAGTAKVVITGVGNYNGTKTIEFNIAPKSLDDAVISQIAQQVYTGDDIEPAFTVTDGTTTLVADKDFSFEYVDNKSVGTATINIEGIGNYVGERSTTFDIIHRDINEADISGYEDVVYNGSAYTPTLTVALNKGEENERVLVEGEDYSVEFKDNTNAGQASAVIKGIGGYNGENTITFEISPKSLLDDSIKVVMIDDYIFTGSAINPEGSLTDTARNNTILSRNSDYTVRYENNVVAADKESEDAPCVIVEGTNNYTGTITVNFTISPAPIRDAEITGVADVAYNRQAHEPVPTVKLYPGTDRERLLIEGTDYEVEYANNTDAGTAMVFVQGIGNYSDAAQKTFTIEPKDIADVAIAKVDDLTYTGDSLIPEINVTDGEDALVEGKDYSLEATDNTDVGEATVTVTGIGNYRGSQTLKFNINSRSLADAEIAGAGDVVYTGGAFTPEVTVTLGAKKLVKDVDYTVAYSDNTDAGTAKVTVSGMGGYSGQAEATFQINPKSINDVSVAAIGDATYSGDAITPSVALTDPAIDDAQLALDKDFTVEYANNIDAGTIASVNAPSIVITGAGNYTGSRTISFTILPKGIDGAQIADIADATFNGSAQTPEPTITLDADSENPVVLVKDTDYELAYENNVNAGSATLTVRGINNYTGSISTDFRIVSKDIASADIAEIADQTFTGSQLSPKLEVSDGQTALVEGTDFTVTYVDNISVGEATATITGIGNYSGQKSVTFNVVQKSLAEAKILGVTDASYNGSAHTPEPVVVLDGKVLEKDADYSVTYSDNTDAGKATVTVAGINGYSETATAQFNISPKNISDGDVSITEIADAVFSGEAIEPALTITDNTRRAQLVADTDFTVAYANNTDAATVTSPKAPVATITGTGNYTGTRSISFTIAPRGIDDAVITGLADVAFTDAAFTPEPTVEVAGKTLVKGADYTVAYENNSAAGTATVTITGIGNYTGSTSGTFEISAKDISTLSLGAIADQAYTGSPIKPAVKLVDGSKELEEGADFTVAYSANSEVGDAPVVTVTGAGNYTGTLTTTFNIVARDISIDDVAVDVADGNVYTGSELTPAVTVTDSLAAGPVTLRQDVDYKLVYSNNKAAGNAESFNPPMVTLTGMGNYKGVKKVAFAISPKTFEDVTVEDIADQVYAAGSEIEPKLTVKDGATTLRVDRDYEVEYSDNVDAGTAWVRLTGLGNYSGTIDTSFNITKKSIQMAIMAAFDPQTYNGEPIEPEITLIDGNRLLVEDVDYSIEFTENTNAGTASVTLTGLGNYNGTKVVRFPISAKSLAGVQISDIDNETYDGNAHTPHPEVTLDGRTLKEGVDYAISYSNNVDCGTAAVTITGTGNYNGMVSSTFDIEQRSIDDAVVSEIADEVYRQSTDHLSTAHEPTPTVNIGERRLIKDLEYELSYENNTEAGVATVKISGLGNYKGEITRTFNITKRDLGDAFISPLPDQTLTIGGNTPTPSVTIDGVTIQQNADYTISYANNDDVGEATLTITGIGNYTGEKSMTFKIVAHPFTYETKIEVENQVYDGSYLEPEPTVTIGTKVLERGVEYVVSYSDNRDTGNATLTITGIGNYSGTASTKFAIEARQLGDGSGTGSPNDGITVMPIEDQVYASGTRIRPDVTVLDRGTVLELDRDFIVTYADNANVEDNPVITIMGKGNYQGELKTNFNIVPKPLSDNDVSLVITENSSYTGEAQTPSFVVKNGDTVLNSETDYTFEYINNVNAGTIFSEAAPTVIVRGVGNYGSEKQALFTINQKSLSSATIDGLADATFTGEAITYPVTVDLEGKTLEEGVDYETSYDDTNVNAGTATLTVKGINNYRDSVSSSFAIKSKTLAGSTISSIPDQTYTGSAISPAITITNNGVELVKDKDYVIAYSSNTNVGKATYRITGIGNYQGPLSGTYNIVAKQLSTLQGSAAAQTYTGSALTPEPIVKNGSTTLVKGTDYTVVEYKNNLNAGTATVTVRGAGNYAGDLTISFAIAARAISASTISKPANQTYTGAALTPTPTVRYNGATLTAGSDYTLTWSNNVNAGNSATVTITGKGNFTGTANSTFTISPMDLTGSAIAVATPAVNYTGAAQMPAVAVTTSGKALASGADFDVAYGNNINAGTATVVVTGKGNYTGTLSGAFVINKIADKITGGTKSKSLKASALKKKKTTFKINAKAKTTVKYKVKKYVKVGKITTAKAKKAVKIASNGTVTVAKKTAKGTYKVQITITSAGNANYNKATSTLTLQVKVK